MRTAAGSAIVAILGAVLLASGAEKPALPPPPPPAAPPAPPGGPAPAAPAPATPGTPAPIVEAPVDPVIAGLVKQLGSEKYQDREAAGAALEAKGEKALPDLRRALGSTDNPEIARRLTVLVRKMEYDRLVAPKRVTLAVKDKSPKEVLDEIGKQTGYKIEYGGGGPEPKLSFEFDKAPFWVAIDKVASTAGLYVSDSYGDDVIRVYRQDTVSPHVAYAGPFRFMATQINTNRSIQLSGLNRSGIGNNRQHEHMGLSFQIHSEPKNPMLGTTQTEVIAATDESGGSLVPPKNDNDRFNGGRTVYYGGGGYRGYNAYGNLNLVRGNRDATMIKTLKAKVGIILLAGTTPELVIAEPTKVKNKKFVGRTVEITLDSLTEAGGNYSVNLTVSRLGAGDGDEQDWAWTNNLWQKLELVDEKGVKFQNHGPNNINNNAGAVTMTGQFGPEGSRNGRPVKMAAPAKLIYNEWHTVTHEVTFEFKNIPLP